MEALALRLEIEPGPRLGRQLGIGALGQAQRRAVRIGAQQQLDVERHGHSAGREQEQGREQGASDLLGVSHHPGMAPSVPPVGEGVISSGSPGTTSS